jgi:hypothetical protein
MRPQLTVAARLPAAFLLVLALAACSPASGNPSSGSPTGSTATGSEAPSATASSESSSAPTGASSSDVPTGCLGLEEAECLGVREIALSRLPAGSPEVAYVRVGPFGCADGGSCAPTLAERPEGSVMVEFVDGSTPVRVSIKAVGDAIQAAIDPEVFTVLVPPSSPAVGSAVVETELGHCGVGSGIDVDGSYWNPIGLVDSDHNDFINSAPATFTLLTPNTARLETRDGLTLELVRHPGSKHLELCA